LKVAAERVVAQQSPQKEESVDQTDDHLEVVEQSDSEYIDAHIDEMSPVRKDVEKSQVFEESNHSEEESVHSEEREVEERNQNTSRHQEAVVSMMTHDQESHQFEDSDYFMEVQCSPIKRNL